MRTLIQLVSPCLLVLALGGAAVPRAATAQARATVLGPQGTGCLVGVTTGCGIIEDPLRATDTDATSAASVTPGLVNSTTFMQAGFDPEVPSGTFVTFRIGFSSPQPLTLALIGNTRLFTYGPAVAGTLGNPATRGQMLQEATIDFTNVRAGAFVDVTFFATVAFSFGELDAVTTANLGGYTALLYQITTSTTGVAGTVVSGPLPVELMAFTGRSRGGAVELNWATASEKNNDHFVVERTTGAQDRYLRLGEVSGAGTSTGVTNYNFVDAQPVGLGYYRLRQVDRDGTSRYSPVVAVRSTPAPRLLAYPNPTTGLLTVAGPAHARFTIVNRLGQVMQQGETGVAMTSQVDLRGLPASVYFLREEATGAVVKIVMTGTDVPQ